MEVLGDARRVGAEKSTQVPLLKSCILELSIGVDTIHHFQADFSVEYEIMAKKSFVSKPTGNVPRTKTSFTSKLLTAYLFLYNAVSLILWFLILSLLVNNVYTQAIHDRVFTAFPEVYPVLFFTQSLAVLEVFHSLFRLVRAPVVTTLMQVSSRLLVVWLVLFVFGSGGLIKPDGIAGVADRKQPGDYAFIGAVAAWSVTECIRYSFFSMQVIGISAPRVIQWLRYNTFFVLYPVGIVSECVLIYSAIQPAWGVQKWLAWIFIAVLGIYPAGMTFAKEI